MNIHGQPIHSDAPHVRIVNAVWNTGTRPLQSQGGPATWDHAVSGIVLVYDTITGEYKARWGSFSHHNTSSGPVSEILEHAQHIATWGYSFPIRAAEVLFGDLTEPPGFAQGKEWA